MTDFTLFFRRIEDSCNQRWRPNWPKFKRRMLKSAGNRKSY